MTPGRRSFASSSNRRRVGWSIGPGGRSQRSAIGKFLMPVGATAFIDGLTLIRTRGELVVRSASVGSVNDEMIGAFGIADVTAAAFAAGGASIPGPFTDADWDGWIWHQFFTVGGLANNGSGVGRYVVDSKAMRKTTATNVVVAMGEVGVETGVVTLDVSLETRILDKLP